MAGSLGDECRFVALATMRNRSEVGAIGFNQHTIERYLRRGIANLLGFRKAYISGKRNYEAHIERALGVTPGSGKAVENAAEPAGLPVSLNQAEAIFPCVFGIVGLAAVDDDRELRSARRFHLTDEDLLLAVARGMVVEIVQANFSPSDDLFVSGKLFQFGEGCVVREFGLVGVDANGSVHKRILLSEANSAVEDGRAVAIADGDDRFNSGLASALDNLLAVGLELLAIEMCVRVDEHSSWWLVASS